MTIYYDPVEITETDIPTDGLWTQDDIEEDLAAQWDYYHEVTQCCRGKDWTCAHYGHYVDLDDRFTYREDW